MYHYILRKEGRIIILDEKITLQISPSIAPIAGAFHELITYDRGKVNIIKEAYNPCIGADDCDARLTELEQASLLVSHQKMVLSEQITPPLGRHSIQGNPGFFLGLPSEPGSGNYFGISQGTEGNIIVVGGNGSGKSASIANPTLRTWRGAICAADIKGELSEFYKELYQKGLVTRPYIIFDPTQIDGPSFDPFWWPLRDGTTNLIGNIKEIAMAIAPVLPDDKQPFWAETERGALSAAFLRYFELGLSFSEAMCKILSSTMGELCAELAQSQDVRVRMVLGEMAAMKPETLANVDRGLRNKLMLFATDPYISHAFRGQREGAKCFTWEDLNTHNIFLRIPADRIEQWGGAINLNVHPANPLFGAQARNAQCRRGRQCTDPAVDGRVRTVRQIGDDYCRPGNLAEQKCEYLCDGSERCPVRQDLW